MTALQIGDQCDPMTATWTLKKPKKAQKSRKNTGKSSKDTSKANANRWPYGKDGDPYGIRTRVAGVKGRCPRPLDEGVVEDAMV